MADFETAIRLPEVYDLRRTMWLTGMGYSDPSRLYENNQVVLGLDTPEGLTTVAAKQRNEHLLVQCWGAGSEWLDGRFEDFFGLNDKPQEFQPTGKLGDLNKQYSGIHMPKLPRVFEKLVQIVLQQLVSWNDASRGWRKLVNGYGVDMPGPHGIRKGPGAEELKRLGYADLMACDILPKQARLILRLAREAKRIERLAENDTDRLVAYLQTISGVGPWTIHHLLGTALGAPDAVLLGDYGLPHSVSWFFKEKARSNDEEMVKLLEPFLGHRFRVIGLMWHAGVVAPKFGPKMRTNRWRFTTK